MQSVDVDGLTRNEPLQMAALTLDGALPAAHMAAETHDAASSVDHSTWYLLSAVVFESWGSGDVPYL